MLALAKLTCKIKENALAKMKISNEKKLEQEVGDAFAC